MTRRRNGIAWILISGAIFLFAYPLCAAAFSFAPRSPPTAMLLKPCFMSRASMLSSATVASHGSARKAAGTKGVSMDAEQASRGVRAVDVSAAALAASSARMQSETSFPLGSSVAAIASSHQSWLHIVCAISSMLTAALNMLCVSAVRLTVSALLIISVALSVPVLAASTLADGEVCPCERTHVRVDTCMCVGAHAPMYFYRNIQTMTSTSAHTHTYNTHKYTVATRTLASHLARPANEQRGGG